MRSNARVTATGMTFGLALICATALTPGMAAADHERHERKHEVRRDDRHDGRGHDRRDDRHDRCDVRYDRRGDDRDCRDGRSVMYVRPTVYVQPSGPCYYDPYSGRTFASLTLYLDHVRRQRNASFAWVFQVGSSTPVYACRWVDDRWVRLDYACN